MQWRFDPSEGPIIRRRPEQRTARVLWATSSAFASTLAVTVLNALTRGQVGFDYVTSWTVCQGLLVGAVWLAQYVPAVQLRADGLVVRRGVSATQVLPWSQIRSISTGPSAWGGSRLRVTGAFGTTWLPAPVHDRYRPHPDLGSDVAVLVAAWERHGGHAGALPMWWLPPPPLAGIT